ncbi:MAG: endonuclease VIII [Sedimenticola sp.]|nr:endonuclease VIII [Sedimenticola sp.]
MPEGPEIRRAADQVESALRNKPLQRAWSPLPELASLPQQLEGRRVTRVDTRGKAMLTRFDNGLTLYTHNQLYGRWYTGPADLQPDTGRQLRLALVTPRSAALLYSASTIELLSEEQLKQHSFLARLGPDVLAPDTTPERILDRIRERRFRGRRLGSLLTDQGFIAGPGNYLRCEILFVCGLHPSLRPLDCTLQQQEHLARAIRQLTLQSYHTRGITNDMETAEKLMARGASFEQARFYVYRRQGLACYRCASPIVKSSRSGQACYHCPTCQPAP